MCKCVERMNKKLADHNTHIPQVTMVNMETGKARQSLTIVTQKHSRSD